MKQDKEVKISYWAAHLTTIVSVTLVLLIIGVIALSTFAAAVETRRLREKIEISMVMADSIGNDHAKAICTHLAQKPYVLNPRLITKEEALRQWTEDTGEDLQALFGVNPLSPEVTFSVRAEYASPARLAAIGKELSAMEGVETVAAPDTAMVEKMNSNIETASMVLGAIALVMVVISFVLINNTVHLSVYARRFTIHTMQLVGATNGFIRRPYIINNMLSGLISGVLASGILALGMVLSQRGGVDLLKIVSWEDFIFVAGGLLLAGALLCGIAALLATSRYLRKDYDKLFR